VLYPHPSTSTTFTEPISQALMFCSPKEDIDEMDIRPEEIQGGKLFFCSLK